MLTKKELYDIQKETVDELDKMVFDYITKIIDCQLNLDDKEKTAALLKEIVELIKEQRDDVVLMLENTTELTIRNKLLEQQNSSLQEKYIKAIERMSELNKQ